MATFDDTLFTYLSGHAGLSALVGDKIYPDKVPQEVKAPYIVYTEINRQKNYTHGGYNGTSVYSEQISCFAATKDQVSMVAKQVELAMVGWKAANPSAIGYAIQDDENSGWDNSLELEYIDQYYDVFYVDN